jgi:hypothetical protein
MGFSTKECAWHQTSIKVLGATIVGIRGMEFNKNVEKEYLHAAGNEPIDIQTGNKTYPGTLKLLKYEVDKMNDAALAAGYADITEIPHEAIVITSIFRKRLTDAPRNITAAGVAFTALPVALDQNGKFTEMAIPFLAMKTVIK